MNFTVLCPNSLVPIDFTVSCNITHWPISHARQSFLNIIRYSYIFPEQKRFPLSLSSFAEPMGEQPHENEAIE